MNGAGRNPGLLHDKEYIPMTNIHTGSANVLFGLSFDAVLANSTQNGTGVDTLGYSRATVLFNAWTGSGTTVNFTVSDSPDNTTFTVVTGATLASAIAASTADAGTQCVDIDLTKRQRYLRVNIVGTGTAGNACAIIACFNPANAAVTQAVTPLSV
jgi:hypothetical protein